eukprot:scaffold33743_cov81-Phaeocystis_antarctica.AAC.2
MAVVARRRYHIHSTTPCPHARHSRALPIVQHLTSLTGADQLCALHQLRRQRPTPSSPGRATDCASRPNVAAADPALPQAER